MKKIIALMLAMVMTFALASTALAGGATRESFSFWDEDFQTEHPVDTSGTLNKVEAEIEGCVKLTITDDSLQYVAASGDLDGFLKMSGSNSTITVETIGDVKLQEVSYSPGCAATSPSGTVIYKGLHNVYSIYRRVDTQLTPNNFTLKIDDVAKDMTEIQANVNWQIEKYTGADFTKAVATSGTGGSEVYLDAVTVVYYVPETGETTTTQIETTPSATTTAATTAATTSPQTADASSTGLWISLGTIAMIGIATVVSVRKNKEQ